MKTLLKYKSDDGIEFVSETECLRHECLVIELQGALAPLGPKVNIGGNGMFKQHDPANVRKASEAVLAIIKREYSEMDEFTFDTCAPDNPSVWHTYLGVFVSETNLFRSIQRLTCINQHTGREYDQPYYAVKSARAQCAPGGGK